MWVDIYVPKEAWLFPLDQMCYIAVRKKKKCYIANATFGLNSLITTILSDQLKKRA